MPYYAYDSRTQYVKPVFVVYDRDHIEPVLTALYGHHPDFIEIYTYRMHQYNGNEESYLGISRSRSSLWNKSRAGL